MKKLVNTLFIVNVVIIAIVLIYVLSELGNTKASVQNVLEHRSSSVQKQNSSSASKLIGCAELILHPTIGPICIKTYEVF